MELSKELIAKARACKSEEELKALAKENNIEIPDEEVKMLLAQNAEGELADEELEAVSCGRACNRNSYENLSWKTEAEVQYLFNVGDVTKVYIGKVLGSETATVRITDRKIEYSNDTEKYYDLYKYDIISGSPTHWGMGWLNRNRFER